MTAPRRIQRKRTKGWRMPSGCIYVGRPTKYGNGNTVHKCGSWWWVNCADKPVLGRFFTKKPEAAEYAVKLFKDGLSVPFREAARRELKGKSLCCWCPLDQPCHGDMLLKIANLGATHD